MALDRNGNGVIDNAKELFGNITDQPPSSTPNGFLALGVFDQVVNGGNDDGILDKRDAIWPRLLVWFDKNHDGVSQSTELVSLDQLGITKIMLGYTLASYVDNYGNKFRYRGLIKAPPGDTVDRIIYDVFLMQGPN